MTTHMMNISGKFHWNPFTKYRDITSRETGVNCQTDDTNTWCTLLLVVVRGIMMSKYNVQPKHTKLEPTVT